MYEIEALESIRLAIERLDHRIGSLYDRLDKLNEPEDVRSDLWRQIREYESLMETEREQYLKGITTVRRSDPGLIAGWVEERTARLERASECVDELTSSRLEAETLLFVIGSLKERWRKLLEGSDEPVIECTTLADFR